MWAATRFCRVIDSVFTLGGITTMQHLYSRIPRAAKMALAGLLIAVVSQSAYAADDIIDLEPGVGQAVAE